MKLPDHIKIMLKLWKLFFFREVLREFPLINEGYFGHFCPSNLKERERERERRKPCLGAPHVGKSPPLLLSFPLTLSLPNRSSWRSPSVFAGDGRFTPWPLFPHPFISLVTVSLFSSHFPTISLSLSLISLIGINGGRGAIWATGASSTGTRLGIEARAHRWR